RDLQAAMRTLILSLFVVACTASPGTSVKLSVHYDPGWALERLDFTIGDQATSSRPASTFVLLLRDDWAGMPLSIRVSGMRDGQRYAAAETVMTPSLGREIALSIDLTRLPCGAWCSPGATTCDGDGVATCEQHADGCMAWSAPVGCPAAMPSCSL